jgi:hypothetical protein
LGFTSCADAEATRASDRRQVVREGRVTVDVLASRVTEGKQAGDLVQFNRESLASKRVVNPHRKAVS